jgi:hypothetical protein
MLSDGGSDPAPASGAVLLGPSARGRDERANEHSGVGVVESLFANQGLPG